MADYPEIQNSNEVAITMPSTFSMSWIVDLLQKFGGTVNEGKEIMLREEFYTNQPGRKQMAHYVTKNNINKISGIVSEQGGNIHEQCETKQDMPASTVVVFITQDADQTSESISGQEGHILQRPVPTFSFYLSGDFAWIGEQGKEISFKIVKGLKYIHFLLQYHQDSYRPTTVYNLGKTLEVGNMVTNNAQPNIEKKLYDFSQDRKQRIAVKNLINKLEIEIDNPSINPLEKCEKEDRIAKLKNALKEIPIRNPGSEEENARTAVQRNIKRALGKIHKKLPCLKRYLNESTIKTGVWCSYAPIPSDPVEWKLFQE